MLFALRCTDKPNSVELRLANREAHLAYVKETGCVRIAGPFLAEDHDTMIGSLVVIEAETQAAAEAWAAGDPYGQAGLFESVEITPWKWVVGAPEA